MELPARANRPAGCKLLPAWGHRITMHAACARAAGISALWMLAGWNYYTQYAPRAEPTVSEEATEATATTAQTKED